MSFFEKLFNSFTELRLHETKAIKGQLLDHILVGAMYAEQQTAYLNTYETGLSKALIKKLVGEYWEIFNHEQAIEVLNSLHNRNQDPYLTFVYQALENPKDYVNLLKDNLPNDDEEVFEYYIDLYQTLKEVIASSIKQGVITGLNDIKTCKDTAWNYGRAAFLVRCCFELGYVSEKEMKDYLEFYYSELKKYCKTWKEYTISYIFGRELWGGSHNNGMISIADSLLNNSKSPLKNKTYL